MIPSPVFVSALAQQTKFSLSSKFSRNLDITLKTSMYVLSTLRKCTTGFLVKSFEKCCGTDDSRQLLVIQSFYSCSDVSIRVGRVKSSPLTVAVRLRQGLVLSPHLFKVCEFDRQSQPVDEVTVGGCGISCLLYVDDFVLLASSEQGHQHGLNWFSAVCNQARMKFSTKNDWGNLSLQKPKEVYPVSERQYTAAGRDVQALGWHSRVTKGGTRRLKRWSVKETKFLVSFIARWSPQTVSF